MYINSDKTLSRHIREEKTILREQLRNEIRLLTPEYCLSSDQKIREQLYSLPEFQHAVRIFCFVGRKSEINTMPILHRILADGKQLAVPRCADPGVMHAHWISRPDLELFPGAWGIPEPTESAPVADPESFDLILIPCCTCTHTGKRLGFGGGYYDRYLSHTSSCRIALCREAIIKDDIPTDRYDLPMDIVLTETGIWKASATRAL